MANCFKNRHDMITDLLIYARIAYCELLSLRSLCFWRFRPTAHFISCAVNAVFEIKRHIGRKTPIFHTPFR